MARKIGRRPVLGSSVNKMAGAPRSIAPKLGQELGLSRPLSPRGKAMRGLLGHSNKVSE